MGLKRDSIERDVVGAERLGKSVRNHKYWRERFMDDPHCYTPTDSNGAPTGTTGQDNMLFTGQNIFRYVILGAGQTIVRPVLGSESGYDIGFDQTAAEGIELDFGSLKDAHYRNMKVGRDNAFARIAFTIEDVSGADLAFGYVKTTAAYETALATYTDLFMIRVLGDSGSAAGQVSILTNLNDATDITETVLSNTLADGVRVEWEIQWRGRTPMFFIDGAEVGPQARVAADLDDFFRPALFFLHTTDVAGQVKLLDAEGSTDLLDRPLGLLSAQA